MSQSVLVISTDYRATRDLGVRECGSVFFPTVRSRQWQQATASPPAGSQANNTSVTSQNCESVEPESEATHITQPKNVADAGPSPESEPDGSCTPSFVSIEVNL